MQTTAVHRSYETDRGIAYCGDSLNLLDNLAPESVDLILTSPPFPLLRKKPYGNEEQVDYVDWLMRFGQRALPVLKSTGSFVLDLGGAYQKGKPVRSLYQYHVLIRFVEELGYHLAEEFFWHNPSKLPSPTEWVNKRKIRAKDTVNTVWWFSKTEWPQANVRNVRTEYSERMKKLLKDSSKYYTPKERPSGHDISERFGKNNGGALPSNMLSIPNTESNSTYLRYCRSVGAVEHPAKFPAKLPEFFVRFLTGPGDVVLDIFAGSNTTGEVAESLQRRWIACYLDQAYVAASALRFVSSEEGANDVYQRIMAGEAVSIESPYSASIDEQAKVVD
ncbi:MAG TPA: site-specific DNA-methyltransferase [Thermomicrobiales bacterium]|nr:site-specific DNA-methyltransferase [Thermomicrobiales bacterium]